jgi:methylmalonyl-CoA mutase
MPYKPKHKIRIVTATSLFDGHDAAINIMRRIMQANGVEVIHLGHDRSVAEVVNCAIQEDVNAIAITSYQGGHIEYLKYMVDLLKEKGCQHIKIFAGGGGVILPNEIKELQNYGVTRIYSPDDGRTLGLEGMIIDLIKKCDFPIGNTLSNEIELLKNKDSKAIGRLISSFENFSDLTSTQKARKELEILAKKSKSPILGVTGTGGAGKSSLVDEIVRRYLSDFPDKTIGIISIDPTKRKTGGALLGDRIRMNSIKDPRVYMRSMATRQSNQAVSKYIQDAINLLKAADFDFIILETSGIGQSDSQITEYADVCMYVMTPEYGASMQLEKIDMLDFADVVAVNKSDKRGALDALRDVKKQYQRNNGLFSKPIDQMPVIGTIASQFNDPGMNRLYSYLVKLIIEKTDVSWLSTFQPLESLAEKIDIIPAARIRYLSEIVENNRNYDKQAGEQAELAQKLFGIKKTIQTLKENKAVKESDITSELQAFFEELKTDLEPKNLKTLKNWEAKKKAYKDEFYTFHVRNKEIKVKTHTESLSHLQIPKIATPNFEAWGEILKWSLTENFPGEFPYTAGIYPFKRENEDPTRMFAGEGGPERTNKRFHYVSAGLPTARLSTDFDSVTLYGQDPELRPDIYGKIGNAGVSVPSLDDAKKLYSGFNLSDPTTSVSMTINGPAPTLAAFFMNAAIDQQCELYIKENGLEEEVVQKINTLYKEKGISRPIYNLPE